MNLTLIHGSFEPIMYGIALFLSFLSMAWKIKKHNFVGFGVELMVVSIILLVHGGSVTGGFAATIAGLLSGTAIPMLFPHSKKTVVVKPVVNDTPKPSPISTEHIEHVIAQYQQRTNAGLAKHIFDSMPR